MNDKYLSFVVHRLSFVYRLSFENGGSLKDGGLKGAGHSRPAVIALVGEHLTPS
jgi:hypothetical protein